MTNTSIELLDTIIEEMNAYDNLKLDYEVKRKKAAKQRILNTVYYAELNTKKYYKVLEEDEFGDERIVYTHNKKTALKYMKERTEDLIKNELMEYSYCFLLLRIEEDDTTGIDTKYSFFND